MLLVEVGREEHCPSQPSLLKLFSLQASEMDGILLAGFQSHLLQASSSFKRACWRLHLERPQHVLRRTWLTSTPGPSDSSKTAVVRGVGF
jgi:hypothetical protein